MKTLELKIGNIHLSVGNTNMKNLLKTIPTLLIILIFVDVIGFTAWATSGQMPNTSEYFVGYFTYNLIGLFIN